MAILPNTELLKVNYIQDKNPLVGKFVLEPLLPGYGLTIGHALRRVLLSSLGGAAISSVKISNVTHEFSTLPGVKEDIVEIILNLKSLRLKLQGEEKTSVKLEKKGPGKVTAKDFQKNSLVSFINPEQRIATLDKNGKLVMEATIKKGRGYETVESKQEEKLPLGEIVIDSIFTPIKKIHYEVENTRVGGMTNYDKLTLEITTDGSIIPKEALQIANNILIEHFNLIAEKIVSKKTIDKSKAQLAIPKLPKKTTKKKKQNDTKTNKKAVKKGKK